MTNKVRNNYSQTIDCNLRYQKETLRVEYKKGESYGAIDIGLFKGTLQKIIKKILIDNIFEENTICLGRKNVSEQGYTGGLCEGFSYNVVSRYFDKQAQKDLNPFIKDLQEHTQTQDFIKERTYQAVTESICMKPNSLHSEKQFNSRSLEQPEGMQGGTLLYTGSHFVIPVVREGFIHTSRGLINNLADAMYSVGLSSNNSEIAGHRVIYIQDQNKCLLYDCNAGLNSVRYRKRYDDLKDWSESRYPDLTEWQFEQIIDANPKDIAEMHTLLNVLPDEKDERFILFEKKIINFNDIISEGMKVLEKTYPTIWKHDSGNLDIIINTLPFIDEAIIQDVKEIVTALEAKQDPSISDLRMALIYSTGIQNPHLVTTLIERYLKNNDEALVIQDKLLYINELIKRCYFR